MLNINNFVERKLKRAKYWSFSHTQRMLRIASDLCTTENSDFDTVVPAILLHAIGSYEWQTQAVDLLDTSVSMFTRYLESAGVSGSVISQIRDLVYACRPVPDIRSHAQEIVHDAYFLDFLTPVGLSEYIMAQGRRGADPKHALDYAYIMLQQGEKFFFTDFARNIATHKLPSLRTLLDVKST